MAKKKKKATSRKKRPAPAKKTATAKKARSKKKAKSGAKGKGAKTPSKKRLELFARAHRWRLALADLVRERGLTYRDIVMRGTRSTLLKDLARDVSKKVGYQIPYHSVWKFSGSPLLEKYLAGDPPSPERQLEMASETQGRRIGAPRRRRGSPGGDRAALSELANVAEDLAVVAERLRRAVAALGPVVDEREELAKLLNDSLALVRGRKGGGLVGS